MSEAHEQPGESFEQRFDRRIEEIETILRRIDQHTKTFPVVGEDPAIARLNRMRVELDESTRRQREHAVIRREREGKVIESLRAKVVELQARVDGDVALAADVAWIAGVLADYIESMTPRLVRRGRP